MQQVGHIQVMLGLALLTGCSFSQESMQIGNATAQSHHQPPMTEATPRPITPSPLTTLLAAADRSDSPTTSQIQQYLSNLAGAGYAATHQGIWIQTGDRLLAQHQGTTPLSAASLTKVATSLTALQRLGPEHRFVTQIGTTGTVQAGVLQGDLVIQGGADPLFVWEDAIALGNVLNQQGIRQIQGNLVIVGKFYMNFADDPSQAGTFLKEGLNAANWGDEATTQFQAMPAGTAQPQVAISGTVQTTLTAPPTVKPLIKHTSEPLSGILKKMNRYSNNPMAEMVATTVGGPSVVMQTVTAMTGLPAQEIQLMNGSGLGEENRMSPRLVCAMFRAMAQLLQPSQLTLGDILTVVGQDEGVLDERPLPALSVVKSGTLDRVSALAGALPTQQQGVVWFVVINGGGENLEGFRSSQEALLQSFINQWGRLATLPPELTPTPGRDQLTATNAIIR